MGVLSALSAPAQIYILSAIIVTVSVLSAIGAAGIILSFLLFKQLRSFRHQLILGLALSDFWMAINFMSSASMNLNAHNIGTKVDKKFCSFNGFMIQVFVVQTDYWVLTITLCTYLILANEKHKSSWIQEHKWVIWIIPWLLSILWATLGLALIGYGDIGAWCWFTSDRTRLLVNFIPRWLIIITILALYIRLYIIIHKAHTRFMSFDEDAMGSLQTNLSTSGNRSTVPRLSINTATKNASSNTQASGPDDDLEDVIIEVPAREMPTHQRIGRPSPHLKRISYQMMTYPLVYMAIWTIPTIIRIYQATTGKSAPFGIATIDKSCIAIQGFADAIVYGMNENTWRHWRGAFTRSPQRQEHKRQTTMFT